MDQSQTIYTQTPTQVFIKNFIAGFARGLGNIFIYLLFLFTLYHFLIKPQLGQITDFFNSYQETMEIFQNQPQIPSLNLEDMLNQLQPPTIN